MRPTRTWIVVADSAIARIFLANGKKRWQAVDELEHPQSRAKTPELVTEMPALDAGDELPKEQEARVFARELGNRLTLAAHARRFDDLVLVAPPEFMGLLRRELGPPVRGKLRQAITKDLAQLHRQELEERLSEW